MGMGDPSFQLGNEKSWEGRAWDKECSQWHCKGVILGQILATLAVHSASWTKKLGHSTVHLK